MVLAERGFGQVLPPKGCILKNVTLFDVKANARDQVIAATAEFDPHLLDTLPAPDDWPAAPAELAQAVPKRVVEFWAGRLLAQDLLEQLGVDAACIPINLDRSPKWPAGVSGSISHSMGRVAAIVATSPSWMVGVDTEQIVADGALRAILDIALTDAERSFVLDDPLKATLVFSAKEALFKALYPTVGAFFGFECAILSEPIREGNLTLKLSQTLAPTLVSGLVFRLSFVVEGDMVRTWLARRPD